ncbi:MAG: succinyl-CoA synthetase subunit beta [Calditrichaeota bacterium]|nr:acetate--CoA ligase family protein [Calditrichota bacterium]RQV98591.1 MAG: succinyl-CoA synthetase subunit beta [Calditrichota bacterium]
MARLHEYQGKELLKSAGIPVPKGRVAENTDEVRTVTEELEGEVVLKAQVWTTGRFGKGLIQFASDPDEAAQKAAGLFGKEVNNFTINQILVEKKIEITTEYFASLIISDVEAAPVMIFSGMGGTGVEEIVKKHPDKVSFATIDVIKGLKDFQARNMLAQIGISGKEQAKLADILVKLWEMARANDARSAEINPIVFTRDGQFLAADCRITIDDYAVYRHPELNIEIARELNRPPSELDRIAFQVEKNDYRGTFYFIQMAQGFDQNDNYVGFHGAGGGGSMMSMDAVQRKGYKIANFCDTSGNPPASKVYRAAKIILSQKNIRGYFGSGSGVASQEQFHSARGLVKAFREEWINIPAVIRLGGNSEDLAVRILTEYTRDLPAPVEGYKKDNSVEYCAERFDALVKKGSRKDSAKPESPSLSGNIYSFETLTGTVTYDYDRCLECESKICVSKCVPQILRLENEGPVLNITREEAKKGKCTECLACEVECYFHGNKGGHIDLPIKGLEEYRRKVGIA